MIKRTTSWGLSLGVSSTLLMTTVFAPVGGGNLAPVVHAAEKTLSEKEAIALAQKQLKILGEYNLRDAQFVDGIEMLWGKSIWYTRWNKENGRSFGVQQDATSGEIWKYEYIGEERDLDANQKKLTEDQAFQVATQFLKQVATEEERSRLSKPNEYPDSDIFYKRAKPGIDVNFTRIENGIPFLENGFRLIVGYDGEVIYFERRWSEGKLPDASKVIEITEAEKKWDEGAFPTFWYKNMASSFRKEPESYQLVYEFQRIDPQVVDAITGKMLDSYGQVAKERKIEPLGKTIPPATTERKLITKDEAQKIAEQHIKKLPGIYNLNGKINESSSESDKKSWLFEYVLQTGDGKKSDTVHIIIDDSGCFVYFGLNAKIRFKEASKKIEKGITWSEAQESARKFVQTFYPDQVGKIYAVDYVPREKRIKEIWENDEPYEIEFGYLINGIPVDDTIFQVDVDAESGEVVDLYNYEYNDVPWGDSSLPPKNEEVIDLNTAKKVVKDNKKLMLTYFQPKVDGNYGIEKMLEQPLLVYRYIGEKGLVTADGKWHSFTRERKQ
ncbi:YcdB/YcdC domain-containing protein [Brevibacillus sp. DP1.3A]|uniref:YcdB/YcdC domain-containing protein n=1 Tax=Brevibacillus sp. DP1.3A TaxID=2738867 RepID=UPI001D16901C|nr:YcdB/YcdC domain-containing protein [Brevibacillus sp. DP1.3A]UED76410.1 peptidase [Brevibacillus sp. DP1.3A]